MNHKDNVMKTVSDIEDIRKQLSDEFPDAIRGSVAKSNWGRGRKTLHLSYSFYGDTAGGYIIQARGNLFYFIEWDTNQGYEYLFAESTIKDMVLRIKGMFYEKVYYIESPVSLISLVNNA